MCELLLFIGKLQDTSTAACVEHMCLHRPPFISRAEIISVSELCYICTHLTFIVSGALISRFSYDVKINNFEGFPKWTRHQPGHINSNFWIHCRTLSVYFWVADYLTAGFFSFSVLMVFYRTKGFNVTAAIPHFMVDIERILVVKFKCCVWTAVCFLCTWMQDTSSKTAFCLWGSKQAYANSTSLHACSVYVEVRSQQKWTKILSF